jgi:hypothetical protein
MRGASQVAKDAHTLIHKRMPVARMVTKKTDRHN